MKVGTDVVVRHTQHGLLRYEQGRVARLGRGRFYVTTRRQDGSDGDSDQGFYYSGMNCWHPRGQTTLVIPTPGRPGSLREDYERWFHRRGAVERYPLKDDIRLSTCRAEVGYTTWRR